MKTFKNWAATHKVEAAAFFAGCGVLIGTVVVVCLNKGDSTILSSMTEPRTPEIEAAIDRWIAAASEVDELIAKERAK